MVTGRIGSGGRSSRHLANRRSISEALEATRPTTTVEGDMVLPTLHPEPHGRHRCQRPPTELRSLRYSESSVGAAVPHERDNSPGSGGHTPSLPADSTANDKSVVFSGGQAQLHQVFRPTARNRGLAPNHSCTRRWPDLPK